VGNNPCRRYVHYINNQRDVGSLSHERRADELILYRALKNCRTPPVALLFLVSKPNKTPAFAGES
jgi:hypothetical protein